MFFFPINISQFNLYFQTVFFLPLISPYNYPRILNSARRDDKSALNLRRSHAEENAGKYFRNQFANHKSIDKKKTPFEMDRLPLLLYKTEGRKKKDDLYVLRRAPANSCNRSHVNIDTLRRTMTLTMTSFSTGEGGAQDDDDKLAAPSYPVKAGRENHARTTCDSLAFRNRSTEKNVLAR